MQRGLQQNLRLKRRHRRPVHISWHVTGLSLGLLIGVALSAIDSPRFTTGLIWLGLGMAVAVIAFSRPKAAFVALALIAGLVLGLWRGGNEQHALQAYRPFIKQTVALQGVVVEDVSHGEKGDLRLQLKNIHIRDQPLHGKVWVSIAPGQRATIKRSDTITVTGKLSPGFGNLAASMSSARLTSIQRTSNSDYALRLRDWFAAGIRTAIPEPAASLGSGFLVGQHSDLPGNLSEELKAVGLTHAVVASGSNLTILVAFTRKLFGRASKYAATMGGAAMTLGFILITGFSPSMTRAGLVTGLSLAAWYYGRRIHPLVLIPFAAAITVIMDPSHIWGDIGWYLSFSAFAGVLLLGPLLQHYFWGKDYKPKLIMEIFIGTTAAQIATMPIILSSFGTYSSYALLANMLVLPFIPLAMLLTFIAGVAGTALPHGISGILGIPAELVMQYMLKVIHWVANLPGAYGQLTFGQLSLIASYVAILLALLYMRRRTAHNFRQQSTILIGERT